MQPFGLHPDSIVFIGDSSYDLKAAHTAGIPCLCVATGYSGASESLSHKPAGAFDDIKAVADQILYTREGTARKGIY